MLTQISMPSIMGILNCSPDSFYASSVIKLDTVLKAASKMCQDGVDVIDIGGESTRPGSKSVSLQEELDRVLPVIEIIKKELAVFISVDTSKPEVMQAAIDLDVGMINDVNALRAPGAMAVVKNSKVSICLMHKQGITETMQNSPQYSNVVSEVLNFLKQRVQECLANGIAPHRLCIDPGFGFGKTVAHNKKLLKAKRFAIIDESDKRPLRMATSIFSSTRSTTRSVNSSFISISGYNFIKLGINGRTTLSPKPTVILIFNLPFGFSCKSFTALLASSNSDTMR